MTVYLLILTSCFSTLQRFTTEEAGVAKLTANGNSSYRTGGEDDEQARLDALRKKISSLRKERFVFIVSWFGDWRAL